MERNIININLTGISDYIKDKDVEISHLVNKINLLINERDKYKEVLDKIKEEVEYWGYDRNTNDDSAFRMAMKKIHHLLEEIEE